MLRAIALLLALTAGPATAQQSVQPATDQPPATQPVAPIAIGALSDAFNRVAASRELEVRARIERCNGGEQDHCNFRFGRNGGFVQAAPSDTAVRLIMIQMVTRSGPRAGIDFVASIAVLIEVLSPEAHPEFWSAALVHLIGGEGTSIRRRMRIGSFNFELISDEGGLLVLAVNSAL